MAEEIAALEHTGTWDIVPLPSSTAPITCKWVYKIKTRSDGSIERYKARLTFAPVAHRTTVHTLVAVASVRRWAISQLDVKNAFLHGELHEEVYMHPPPVYTVPDGHVCRLRRSLYGLMQAPRAWFERFTSVVTAAGFVASQHDPALFVHTLPRGRTLILLYVDDMLITGDDLEYIAFVKACLSEQFHMSVLGSLSYFLGIEVSSTSDGYYLSQRKYIQDILTMLVSLISTPRTLPWIFTFAFVPQMAFLLRIRLAIAIFIVYLGITRPDISYDIHILSQFMSAPTSIHYGHLLRILRYLRGNIDQCLFFSSSSSLQLYAYSDATRGTDPSDFKSISTYCVFLGSSLISWKTKKQTDVARSSAEAELRALACVTAEVTWLQWLLADFGVAITSSTPDPVKHQLTKHIGIDCFFIRIVWFLSSMCLRSCSLQICLPRVILELNMVFFSPNSVLLIHHEFEGGFINMGCALLAASWLISSHDVQQFSISSLNAAPAFFAACNNCTP
ncbi:LOW QUALITY PROTEIN: hypothetical protein U9M48_024695 [Paspalum notatum var. saurae]|uniref:Reverse transcriptase Ty1/copia-type domain-containing protein n=1 Tax=Paspalum notatum var. saurae TaxID=547442 RepID=A0AAQ3WWC9_PASNO